MSRILARPLDTLEVVRVVHRGIARVLDASICLFGVYDAAAETVTVVWQIHNGQELPGGSFPLGNGFTSQVIRTGEPLLIRDWSASGPRVEVHYATEHAGLPQSTITAPVTYDGQVRGVLSVQSYRPAAFDEDDLALLVAVADQAASAIFGHAQGPATAHSTSTGVGSLLTSMAVGVLVLDRERRLVSVNRAARRLLCPDGASLILGHPIDRPQGDRWPLGTHALTEAVRSLLDRLNEQRQSTNEIEVEGTGGQHLACSASVLFADGTIAGELLQFRDLPAVRAA